MKAPRYRLITLSDQPVLLVAETGAECLRFSKQLAVVTYLASRPGAQATRDELIGLLWGGSSSHDARQALRQVVYQIRRATGPDSLAGDELLSLQPSSCEFDVAVFREHLAAGQLQQALTIYEADFLASVSLSGAREFEEWADGLRRQLATEQRQLLRTLMTEETDAGRWATAGAYAERLIAADPYDLEPRLKHIELLALAGDAVRAAAAAEETRALAAATKGSHLSPSVEQSIGRALHAGGPEERRRGNGFPRHPEMVGRAAEFRRILDRWKRAQEGEGSGVLITGEPGIGKTRLVLELERRLQRDRGLIVRTACYAIEQSDPLSPFLDALRQAHSAPGLGGAAPASLEVLAAFAPEVAERFRATLRPRPLPIPREALYAALVDGFVAIAEQVPLALFVEDLHWAPPGTAEFAHRLARNASTTSLLCVLTARDLGGPVGTPWLPELTGDAALTEVPLKPLDAPDVEQMVASIAELPGGEPADRLLAWIMETSGGVPLYVLEGLKAAYDAGWLKVQQGRWVIQGKMDELPRSSSQVFRNRLSALSDAATSALAALAVKGKATDVDALARIAGLSIEQLREALEGLERRRLVGRAAGLLVIAHDEVAVAVLRETPNAALELFHARACELAEQEAAAGRAKAWPVAARHAAGAGDAPRAALNAARAVRTIEQMSGRNATREAAHTLLEGMREDVRLEVARLLQRVLDGNWPAGRWLAEQSGAARRRRWIAAAAAFALLGAAAAGGVRLARPAHWAMLGGGYLAVGSWLPGEASHGVRAFRLDSNYDLHQAPVDSLPAGVRAGYQASFVHPDQGLAVFVCTRLGQDPVVLCATPPGRADTTILGSYESDAAFGGWLPDGSGFLMRGGRLVAGNRFVTDVLVMDTTGRVRQAVRRGGPPVAAVLAPDGERIALGGGGTPVEILDLSGSARATLSWCAAGVAWSPDARRVACFAMGAPDLMISDADSGAVPDRLPLPAAIGGSPLAWSPDGRFVAVLVNGGRPALLIASRDGSRVRRVAGLPRGAELLGWVPSRNRAVPSRLVLHTDSLRLRVGSSATVRAELLSARGAVFPGVVPLRIRVEDSAVARLVADTALVADRPGQTRVIAHYARMADTATVTVVGADARLLLHDDFDQGLDTSRWKPFGFPLPRTIPGAGLGGSRAFHNNGDYSHTSGVVYLRKVPTTNGLTVAFWARLWPVKNPWQELNVNLSAAPPDAFRTGQGQPQPAGDRGLTVGGLSVSPGGDTVRAGASGNGAGWPVGLPRRFLDGAWHHYRFVLYPSGELRFFADGAALGAARTEIPTVLPRATLWLGGRSVGTLLLVDDFEVWEGVVLETARDASTGATRRSRLK